MHKPQRKKEIKLGSTKLLSLQIQAMINNGHAGDATHLMAIRNALLVNGNRPPIPERMLNQRQKRKQWRQRSN
jgi:hypothetical protein